MELSASRPYFVVDLGNCAANGRTLHSNLTKSVQHPSWGSEFVLEMNKTGYHCRRAAQVSLRGGFLTERGCKNFNWWWGVWVFWDRSRLTHCIVGSFPGPVLNPNPILLQRCDFQHDVDKNSVPIISGWMPRNGVTLSDSTTKSEQTWFTLQCHFCHGSYSREGRVRGTIHPYRLSGFMDTKDFPTWIDQMLLSCSPPLQSSFFQRSEEYAKQAARALLRIIVIIIRLRVIRLHLWEARNSLTRDTAGKLTMTHDIWYTTRLQASYESLMRRQEMFRFNLTAAVHNRRSFPSSEQRL